MSTINSTPRKDGFFMPAEWERQDAVWMIFPYRNDNWRRSGIAGELAYSVVAEAILAYTPVNMAVPHDKMDLARKVIHKSVNLVELPSDDAWCRDSGPTIVVNSQGEKRAINWKFNAYGEPLYTPYDNDAALATKIAAYHGIDVYDAPIVLEGGSIHTDGEGTCLTTEECLLNPNRNPGYTKDELEKVLQDYLGVSKVIWLKEGVFDDETSGHIDNMACFIKPGEVLLTWTDDESDPQYARSKAAYDLLTNSTDAQGRKLKV